MIHTYCVHVSYALESTSGRSSAMNIDRLVFAFAGSFVLVSLLLSLIHSHYWLWLTALAGANMLQASITGFCPSAKILKALGFKSGEAFR